MAGSGITRMPSARGSAIVPCTAASRGGRHAALVTRWRPIRKPPEKHALSRLAVCAYESASSLTCKRTRCNCSTTTI